MARSKFSLPRKAIDSESLEQFAAGADSRDASSPPAQGADGRDASSSPPVSAMVAKSQAASNAADEESMSRSDASEIPPPLARTHTRQQRLESAIKAVMPEVRELDRAAKPTFALNVRLNAYELGLLRLLAQKQDRSQHWVLKKSLIPALEKLAKDAV